MQSNTLEHEILRHDQWRNRAALYSDTPLFLPNSPNMYMCSKNAKGNCCWLGEEKCIANGGYDNCDTGWAGQVFISTRTVDNIKQQSSDQTSNLTRETVTQDKVILCEHRCSQSETKIYVSTIYSIFKSVNIYVTRTLL